MSRASQTAAPLAWADVRTLTGLFGSAAERAGIVERDFTVAGLPVRISAAGPALLDRIAPALAHLALEVPTTPALHVHVWDSLSTGAPEPERPSVGADDVAPKARYYFGDDRIHAAYQPSGEMLSVYDRESETAWYWTRDAAELPFLDEAEPIRLLLHWWLGERGVQMLHGGAVGTSTGGVLITGKNGSGKSTATLASLAQLGYAGDDYVAVRMEPRPTLYSLYNSGKLEHDHATRLPHLATGLLGPDAGSDEKAVIYVRELFPDRIATEFPLRAILVPRITERRHARLVPTSPSRALSALAPTTLLQLHPPQPDALANMGRLVRELPTFELELGSDMASIPEAILAYLDGCSS